jgi:hypothetical protein
MVACGESTKVALTAPATLTGDPMTVVSLDAEFAPGLELAVASGYYWAPYLGGPNEAPGDTSWKLPLVAGLRAAGKLSPGWWVDYNPTTASGQAAVTAAKALGYVPGNWILLDGEGIFQSGLGVGAAWAAAVHAAGFKAGAYGYGLPRGGGNGSFDGLFLAAYSGSRGLSNPPALPSDLVGWQYTNVGSVAGTSVDGSVISTAIIGGK